MPSDKALKRIIPKKFAEEEFGGGFAHHEIALWQGHNEQMPIAVKPMFGRWS